MDNKTEIEVEEIKSGAKVEETAVAIRSADSFKTPFVREAVNTIYGLQAGLNKRVDDFKKAEETARKETAKLLYQISEQKLYKTEGFKSLAEFAETIGIKKSEAHKLADSGRLLANTNDKVREYAEKASLSNMRELASVSPMEVMKAIESGDITPGSTVQEIKAWKAKVNPAKPKVVDRMDYVGTVYFRHSDPKHSDDIKTFADFCYNNVLPDELDFMGDYIWSFVKVGEERVHIGFNPSAMQDDYNGPIMTWYVARKPISTTPASKKIADKDAEIAELKAKLEALMAQLAK